MPWENGRKRRHSDVLQDPYKGPQEFMEAGVRGFLVTSVPDREEHALDEAVKCLRKACVKLYGGIRPLKKEDASFAKGYVMIDFMEPDAVVPLPHPDADKFAAEEKEKAEAEAAKAQAKESEKMEEDNKEKVEAEEVTEDKEKTGNVETEETKAEETKEEGDETKTKEEKAKEEQKKKEELKKKKREEEEKAKPPLMLAPHKFKSFRTELRNIMFIKSDVVDPVEVINTAFDLITERKPLFTDCINQILPIQGVCDNDYKQLEIMCRRVLAPYVGEHLEEPPSFGVMLIDKMCEPGAEILLEVVRSVIWCLNPMAWQSSPWCEPDVVIHLEIIGSKIILSAMPQYMKFRQYSPFALHELGHGKPEDEEKLLRERKEDDDKEKDKGRDRGRKKKDSNKKREEKKKEDKEKKKDDVEKKDEGEKKNETEEASKKSEEEKTEEVKEEEKESTEASDEKKGASEVKRSSRSKGDKKASKS